jgi:hypothetical protein
MENTKQYIRYLIKLLTKQNQYLEELISLAVQYRDDLRHPITDSMSIDRRLKWVSETLSRLEKEKVNV